MNRFTSSAMRKADAIEEWPSSRCIEKTQSQAVCHKAAWQGLAFPHLFELLPLCARPRRCEGRGLSWSGIQSNAHPVLVLWDDRRREKAARGRGIQVERWQMMSRTLGVRAMPYWVDRRPKE